KEVPEFPDKLFFIRINEIQPYQEAIGTGQESRHQMHGKPVMPHARYAYQPAVYHIPQEEALEATEKEQDQGFLYGGFGQLFGEIEIEERNNEHQPNKPTYHSVQPFPEINVLKILQVEVIM